jgi:DMSO/TMAO reductase YedYZ molybdopterin-dependent catalytic subunit
MSDGLNLKRRTWISFTVLIFGLVAAYGLFKFSQTREQVDGLPKPYRAALNLNESIWRGWLNPLKRDRPKGKVAKGQPARVNGDIGLESPIDLATWRLTVIAPIAGEPGEILSLSIEDIKKLPRTEIVNQFKCIEGWSETMSFAGVKVSDFLAAYKIDSKFEYIGLETPDQEYYVSVDMKSALSPETLLAYEQNGEPLSLEHGAPLRLVIPNKYGVKSLKRIGRMEFSDTRPRDYWTEQGYDWYAGL